MCHWQWRHPTGSFKVVTFRAAILKVWSSSTEPQLSLVFSVPISICMRRHRNSASQNSLLCLRQAVLRFLLLRRLCEADAPLPFAPISVSVPPSIVMLVSLVTTIIGWKYMCSVPEAANVPLGIRFFAKIMIVTTKASRKSKTLSSAGISVGKRQTIVQTKKSTSCIPGTEL